MGHFPSFRGLLLGLIAACALFSAVGPADARSGAPVIIRDTEIENAIKTWTKPVIKAAGLDPDAVHFIIVQSHEINAFVAGGQNVFLYTGLLEKTDGPGEIVGVVAHELGHISGGHLVRSRDAMENASYESLLGTLLGIGAAVLTGEGGLGAAVAAGSQSAAAGRFLAFSRVQESSADQAGMDYLEKAGFGPSGMLSFMHKLASEELLPATQQSEYVRTHPLTRDRVQAAEAGEARSAYKTPGWPAAWNDEHKRIIAKLEAFISPEQVAWAYDDSDKSVITDYARAIAAYRQNRVEDALSRISALIAREPDNPYFMELKGQMLVDFGRVAEALPLYARAVDIMPDAPLIRASYASALIETAGNDKAKLDEAIRQLERVVRDEPRNARSFRLLATAAGRKGDEPTAHLYLAEEALLKGETDYAEKQARMALEGLKPGSRGALRANDILSFVERVKKKS